MSELAYRLMLVMAFTLPWENAVDVPGLGSLTKIIGLLLGLVWVLSVLSAGRVRRPRGAHVLALLYVLWTLSSLIWTVDGPATQERTFTYVQLLVLMLVVWDTVTSPVRVRQALIAYLSGCYLTVATLLVEYATLGAAEEVHHRVTVEGFHPNDVGIILALGLPIAVYLAEEIRSAGRWRRLWQVACLAYVPLSGFSVLVTGSRAGLGALLPGFAFGGYLLARRRPRLAWGAGLSLVGLTAVALPLVPANVLARLGQTQSSIQSGDLNERGGVWAEAIRLFVHHPIFGIGSGAFKEAAVGANKAGHNFVLSLLAEVGLVGFGLFAGMLVALVLGLRHTPAPLRSMWVAVLVAWLVGALLHNWEWRKQTWFIFALVAACGELSTQDEPAEGETGRPEAAMPSGGDP